MLLFISIQIIQTTSTVWNYFIVVLIQIHLWLECHPRNSENVLNSTNAARNKVLIASLLIATNMTLKWNEKTTWKQLKWTKMVIVEKKIVRDESVIVQDHKFFKACVIILFLAWQRILRNNMKNLFHCFQKTVKNKDLLLFCSNVLTQRNRNILECIKWGIKNGGMIIQTIEQGGVQYCDEWFWLFFIHEYWANNTKNVSLDSISVQDSRESTLENVCTALH